MNIKIDAGGSIYSGGEEVGGCVHVSVHDTTFDPSTGIKHATNLLCVISTSIGTNESSFPFYLVSLYTDGGGDHKPRHIRNQLALFGLFLLGNMDKLNVARVCPGIYFLNISNRAMDFLNIGLSGLTLKSNVQVGDEFLIGEFIGKV